MLDALRDVILDIVAAGIVGLIVNLFGGWKGRAAEPVVVDRRADHAPVVAVARRPGRPRPSRTESRRMHTLWELISDSCPPPNGSGTTAADHLDLHDLCAFCAPA